MVRALWGSVLLAAVWWLWPEPAEFAGDGRRDGRIDGPAAVGALEPLRTGIAASAKGQITGDATVSRARIEDRLRQLARAEATRDAAADAAIARGMPASVTAQPVAEHPVTVLAEPPAGPAVEIVRQGAIGAGADQSQRSRKSEASETGAPMTRTAAAASTAPELSDQGNDAAKPARVVAAPVARAGQPPTWLRNAVAPAIYDRPMIAIVIDDLGMNRSGTAALNHLPAPLTLAFLPYAPKLDEQTRAGRAAGHELLVHVPMEPTGGEWPGPNALTSQLGPTELTSRLRAHLRSFRGFVGINNHMGSRITADSERMDLVMAELRKHDLLFLDSRTSPGSVAAREARRWHVPYAEWDVFLDNEIELTAVLRQLKVVEGLARRRGYAVAIGHPHDVTIEALRRWLPNLHARGFALAPISAIVARRYCAEEGPAPVEVCTHYTATASLMP